MSDTPGSARPGGRTARTREAVHQAVTGLLAEKATDISMASISARSGVHQTTLYRRWRTVEAILLDVAVERVVDQSPVPATGDLRGDLTYYVHRLLEGLQHAGTGSLLQALLAAASQAESTDEVTGIVAPRLGQFQAMLDAAGVTRIDGLRLAELVLAPAYLWAQFGAPLDPDSGTARLVDSVLSVARGPE